MNNKNICIIPARGGSKRLPGKNIKLFLGRPVIYYSIVAAIESGLFDEIMVSTDSIQIAEVAKFFGAKVPFLRSAQNSNDFATTVNVIEEVLAQYEIAGSNFDNICCIYPCAPFITPGKISESYKLLTEKYFDTVLPITRFSYPVQRSVIINNNKLNFLYPEFANSRSQDLEKVYHDAGQFYWLNFEAFKKNKKLITDNTGVIFVNEIEVQDIDNNTDWELAEMKFKLYNKLSP